MNTKPEKPEEIRVWLAAACNSAYEGLLVGALKVQEYFEHESADVDRPLAANLARYHAKHYMLTRRRFNAPYLIAQPPNNGIEIRQDWCSVKVLKGRDGNAPTASSSLRSQRFYRQALQPRLRGIDWAKVWERADWRTFIRNSFHLNLILCWETDFDYNISRMQLMCPRESGKYGEGVKVFWKVDIPHPVQGLIGLESVDEAHELEDLAVYFEDASEQGDDD